MNKRIAVLLSVYKKDSLIYLQEAVESIYNQSITEFKLLIGVDGPVEEDLRTYIEQIDQNERTQVVWFEENRGLACVLNDLLGICFMEGFEFIARMDADDISMPSRLEKQVAYLIAHPDVDCIGTWAIEIKSDGSEFYKKQMPVTHDECWKRFMIRDCMIHPTVMFRRSFIEKAGLYDLNTYFGEDTMMWANGFANGCKFANLPEFLFKFRLNDDFFNRRRGWKHAKAILTLRWKVNKMLNYPPKAYLYAIAYAIAKMMPKGILKIIYRKVR
jgi:glycosyltransferase involved in cell wall biosynthesis